MKALTEDEKITYEELVEFAQGGSLSIVKTIMDKDTPEEKEVAVVCAVFDIPDEPEQYHVKPLAIIFDEATMNRLEPPTFE